MSETTISAKKHILVYGLLIGIIWITYKILRNVTGYNSTYNWVFSTFEVIILHITIISFSIYKYKAKNNGFLTLWQAVKIGLGIAMISALTLIVWDTFFISVISPEILQKVIKITRDQTTDETLTDKGIILSYLLKKSSSNFIYHLTFGFLVSLLGGAIMQKNPDPFDQ